MTLWEEETRWIHDEAKRLSRQHRVAYSSVLFCGLDAYRAGLDDEQIKEQMMKYIERNGTG